MPRTRSLTPEQLLALGQQLRAVSPVDYDPWNSGRPLTRLEMVAMLKDDITAMRDKGHSVVQIAEFLSQRGLNITAGGLYDTMRKLDCSLTRQRVPIARRLARGLARLADAPPPVALGRALATPVHRRKAVVAAPAATLVQEAPQRITILPLAQRLLKKLQPADAVVFKTALSQLRPGNQCVALDQHTADSGRKLTALGLLKPLATHGDHGYEVPYEMAHVTSSPRTVSASARG